MPSIDVRREDKNQRKFSGERLISASWIRTTSQERKQRFSRTNRLHVGKHLLTECFSGSQLQWKNFIKLVYTETKQNKAQCLDLINVTDVFQITVNWIKSVMSICIFFYFKLSTFIFRNSHV